MYNIVFLPSPIEPSNRMGLGRGVPGEHHEGKLDPITGRYLIGKNGCMHFKNCFACPFPQCKDEFNKRAK